MSGASPSDPRGNGTLRIVLASVMGIVQVLANLSTIADFVLKLLNAEPTQVSVLKLSDTGHALAATIVFSLFLVYVMIDMLKFSHQRSVWYAGLAVMAIAVYWWIGFMAKHDIPPEPILPAKLYPPSWAYLVMAACLAGWAFWDIAEAYNGEFEDGQKVFAGGAVLMVSIGLSLFLTLTARPVSP